jgi:hypothetical protein
MILHFIKELLKNEPNTIYKVPWQVNDYKEVMKMLFDFKNKDGKLIIEEEYKHILRMMFTFHLQDKNHVMIFYSNNKDSCLCMARHKGQNININMPVADVVMNADSSFVATYVLGEKNEPFLK